MRDTEAQCTTDNNTPVDALAFVEQLCRSLNDQIHMLNHELESLPSTCASPEVMILQNNIHMVHASLHASVEQLAALSGATESTEDMGGESRGGVARVTANNVLTDVCSTFRLLESLRVAVGELEHELVEGEFDYYRAISEGLTEVHNLLDHFSMYYHVPVVRSIKERVDKLKTALRRKVNAAVSSLGCFVRPRSGVTLQRLCNEDWKQSDMLPSSTVILGDAAPVVDSLSLEDMENMYLVLEALGPEYRNEVLERIAVNQLSVYPELFAVGTEFSGVEFFDRRVAWFTRLMHFVCKSLRSAFPAKMHLKYFLFREFSKHTHTHMSVIVEQLYRVQEEAALAAVVPDVTGSPSTPVSSGPNGDHDLTEHSEKLSDAAEAARNHYLSLVLRCLKAIVAFEKEFVELPITAAEAGIPDLPPWDSSDSIRDAFDNYLSPYVALERRALEDLMVVVMKDDDGFLEDPKAEADAGAPAKKVVPTVPVREPYESSRKLFEFIKGSLRRCVVFSTGKAFLLLTKEFRGCLRRYCGQLKRKCPLPVAIPVSTSNSSLVSGSSTGSPLNVNAALNVGGAARPVIQLNKLTEAILCRIVCTVEYCVDTIPALESQIRSSIRPQMQEKVTFQPQINIFNDLASHAIGCLADGEINRMVKEFDAMKSFNWQLQAVATEPLPHTKRMLRVLSDCVPRIRMSMSPVFFGIVCARLATSFLESLYRTVFQLRRVSRAGGGQLLLDLNEVKEYLQKLHHRRMTSEEDSASKYVISKAYLSAVETGCRKIERVLKLVCADEPLLEEMFTLLWPEATKDEIAAVSLVRGSKTEAMVAVAAVGEAVRGGVKQVGQQTVGKLARGAQAAAGDISVGFSKMGGGIRDAFGSIFDHSAHSTDSNGTNTSAHEGKSLNQSFKAAVSAVNVFKVNSSQPEGATTRPNTRSSGVSRKDRENP